MSVTGKARSAARKGFKVQRRIAITQALFWPIALGSGAMIGAAVLLTAKRRRQPASPPPTLTIDDAPPPGSPAATA